MKFESLLKQTKIRAAYQKADVALKDAISGDDRNADGKFKSADDILNDLKSTADEWKNVQPDIREKLDNLEKEIGVIEVVKQALENKRNNLKPKAIQSFKVAQAQQGALARIAGFSQWLSKQLADLGSDEKGFNESLDRGRSSLEKVDDEGRHLALDDARKSFEKAREQGANATQVGQFLQYIDDLTTCERDINNMRLYRPSNPLKNKSETPWTRDDRALAFCIDRFEWPNEQGKLPASGVLYADAVAQCTAKGKVLCKATDWTSACQGGPNFTQPFPYGVTGVAGNCNTDSKAPVESGSKKPCKNAIGVYDMSGNLAEWVDDDNQNKLDNLATVMGGSYGTPTNQANCTEPDPNRKKSDKYNDVGFRCCLKLNVDK